jgi:hypothetical protein
MQTGYHAVHHANSRLHWSELPARFVQTIDLHDERDGGQGAACACVCACVRVVCVRVFVCVRALARAREREREREGVCVCVCEGQGLSWHVRYRGWLNVCGPCPRSLLTHAPRHPPRHPDPALCFEGIGFFDVGLAVFTGRLGWLADRIVPCGPRQAARGHKEWVALLRRRLQPIVRPR